MANQKGGVAKTSSTRNLAYSLAELGKKVLAVDFDPQTNLTISFGVAPAALQETAASLMMKLVMDEALPEKGSYILNIGKVDLLPSKKTLTVAEVNLLIDVYKRQVHTLSNHSYKLIGPWLVIAKRR